MLDSLDLLPGRNWGRLGSIPKEGMRHHSTHPRRYYRRNRGYDWEVDVAVAVAVAFDIVVVVVVVVDEVAGGGGVASGARSSCYDC